MKGEFLVQARAPRHADGFRRISTAGAAKNKTRHASADSSADGTPRIPAELVAPAGAGRYFSVL
jgi:hypothetical protein